MFGSILEYLMSVNPVDDTIIYDALNFTEGAKFCGGLYDLIPQYPYGSTIFNEILGDSQIFSEKSLELLKAELERREIEYVANDFSVPLCCEENRKESTVLNVKNIENEHFLRIVPKEEMFVLHSYAFIDMPDDQAEISRKIRIRYDNYASKSFKESESFSRLNFSEAWFVAPRGYKIWSRAVCNHCVDDVIKDFSEGMAEDVETNLKYEGKLLINKKYVAKIKDNIRTSFRKSTFDYF